MEEKSQAKETTLKPVFEQNPIIIQKNTTINLAFGGNSRKLNQWED